jgi:hypothetical protein
MDNLIWIDCNAEGFKADKSTKSPEDIGLFYYADGTLKPYAFACGYREHYTRGHTDMYLDSFQADVLCYRLSLLSLMKKERAYTFNGEHALRDARHMRDAILTA